MSFADEVTLLGDAETQVYSPEADLPPLILPVVVTDINVAPETVSPPLILPVVVEESSVAPESIRSLGAGCTFRHTTYRASDYASPVGDYGLPLHHPRFIEWIGVPQSAGLIEISGAQWVDKLSRDQAVAAAVHLQRDVGLMQMNVDVLDQYALSLQKTASRMIELCLGSRGFPAEDVAAGALGPRVRCTAVHMEAMGLWRPSLDLLRLH